MGDELSRGASFRGNSTAGGFRRENSLMSFACTLPLLAFVLGGGEDTVVQSGSLSGAAGQMSQDVFFDQFDDQGGTLELESVTLEVNTSVVGGGTTTGAGGPPVSLLARLDVDFLLLTQLLVATQAIIDTTVNNSEAGQSFSFFDSDSGVAVLGGTSEIEPFVGTGQIALTALTDFVVEEDPPGAVGFSAGGSVDYTLTYTFSTAGGTTFVETFEEGSNEGAWSWGTGNESISPLNGNPGAFLQDLTLSSCCPAASTALGTNSAFTGNYRARGVSSVGIDLITLDASSGVGGRPLSVILVNDSGTPGDFDDDLGAFFIGDTNIPDPGVPGLTPAGWTSFDFDIPGAATTLPSGWQTFDENGLGANDAVWNAVIADVDELQFFYGDPTQVFLFLSWDVGLDNPRITSSSASALDAVVDIRPGTCPNPANRMGRGVLDVALVGTVDFDPALVDVDSVSLVRADGLGRAVGVITGPPGPAPRLVDRAVPSLRVGCACGLEGTDGFSDLLLFFRIDDLNEQLQLDALDEGSSVELVLSGLLFDGTVFSGLDCILLVPPGGGIPLTVSSNLADAWINVAPFDIGHDGGGFAPFDRFFAPGTVITVTAPMTHARRTFFGWRLDGNLVTTRRFLDVTMDGFYELEAVYGLRSEPMPTTR
jgi:hypothetical protein